MIKINAATTSVCRRLAELIAVSVKPADLRRVGVRYTGNAKRVEPRDAAIEEQQVGSCSSFVSRIDPFILAVVNPETVVDGRHARSQRAHGTEFVHNHGAGI